MVLDTLIIPGTILNMASVLNKTKLTCNARAKSNVTVLTVKYETIENMKANINDIDQSVNTYAE